MTPRFYFVKNLLIIICGLLSWAKKRGYEVLYINMLESN